MYFIRKKKDAIGKGDLLKKKTRTSRFLFSQANIFNLDFNNFLYFFFKMLLRDRIGDHLFSLIFLKKIFIVE